MIHRLHLNKAGCSNRGVRYRVLKPQELDHNEIQAARSLEKDDTIAQYQIEVEKLGLYMMVVGYSDPSAKELNGTTKWTKVDPDTLETKWNEIFTTKDTVILRSLYKREHGTSNAEIEDLLAGKVDELEE